MDWLIDTPFQKEGTGYFVVIEVGMERIMWFPYNTQLSRQNRFIDLESWWY